ncbi:unnamed protein product, partial [Rotaria socialis]
MRFPSLLGYYFLQVFRQSEMVIRRRPLLAQAKIKQRRVRPNL